MRVVIQVVKEASVKVDGKLLNEIGKGYVLLVGFKPGDNEEITCKIASKITKLRLFEDENGKTNLSLKDVDGEILSISQFTLYGDVRKGNRPSFINSLEGSKSSELYDLFNSELENLGFKVKAGQFGAKMDIKLINEGPFTLIVDSEELYG
ncbi:MAG: D-aminoacyl-tRNA deacylase [Bacilli bacterium]|jgi:D-tyrosyl-tRNA(Tyr) deacylase|nr:D-aminoacyl-tRNA deacylase [Bacilli bacterium]